MAKAKLTQEQWSQARREWEESPAASYASVAANFMISKALVGQRAASEKWQKGGGVGAHPNDTSSASESISYRAAPSTSHPSSRLDAERPSKTPPVSVHPQSEVVPAAPAPAQVYADELRVPDGLDELDREEFIKRAIVERQKAINAKHIKEIAVVRQQVYAAIKGAGGQGGAGAAMAVQRVVRALRDLQDGDMEAELQRVRLEVAEFVGKPAKPTPCRIVVHMVPGAKIGSIARDDARRTYGPQAVAVESREG